MILKWQLVCMNVSVSRLEWHRILIGIVVFISILLIFKMHNNFEIGNHLFFALYAKGECSQHRWRHASV